MISIKKKVQNLYPFSTNIDIIFMIFLWFSSKMRVSILIFKHLLLKNQCEAYLGIFNMVSHLFCEFSHAYAFKNCGQHISLLCKCMLTMIFSPLLSSIFSFSFFYFPPKIPSKSHIYLHKLFPLIPLKSHIYLLILFSLYLNPKILIYIT